MADAVTGQCLCGSVSFKVTSPIERVDACHCQMCRRWAGGPFMGADVREAGGIAFENEDTLTWFESSDWAERGFCSKCGSSLFYRLKGRDDFWAIASGALDLPAGFEITKEIFIDEKPDFYALAGDRPRYTGEEFLAMIQSSSNEES